MLRVLVAFGAMNACHVNPGDKGPPQQIHHNSILAGEAPSARGIFPAAVAVPDWRQISHVRFMSRIHLGFRAKDLRMALLIAEAGCVQQGAGVQGPRRALLWRERAPLQGQCGLLSCARVGVQGHSPGPSRRAIAAEVAVSNWLLSPYCITCRSCLLGKGYVLANQRPPVQDLR